MRDAGSYSAFSTVGSDKRIVSSPVKLEIFNKFSILSSEDIDSENVESAYENLVRSNEEIAISTLLKKR